MTEHEHPGDPRAERLWRAAASLSRDIPPAVDPWPAIRARIEADRVVPLTGVASRAVHRAPPSWRLVAAAAALVIVSSAVTLLAVRGRTTSQVAAIRTPPAGAAAMIAVDRRRQLVADVCGSYDAAASDLERALRTRRDRLSPRTVRVLEESLRAIDQAIGEARSALEKDPASQDMLDLLDSVYRQKLDLLRRANALPLRSS